MTKYPVPKGGETSGGATDPWLIFNGRQSDEICRRVSNWEEAQFIANTGIIFYTIQLSVASDFQGCKLCGF